MKRRSIIFALAYLLTGACTDGESLVIPSAEEESAVRVGFRLEAVETDTSLEPMTRATSYKEFFNNSFKVLILKKTDTRWIVDTTLTELLDPQKGTWAELKISDELAPSRFGFELRPGDYRIVAVLNPQAALWNPELVPGKVVADEADASLRTPPLITYWIMTENLNKGYRMLNREVFVAVADFSVPKSSDLHASGVPDVALRAERRVAKFRILLKNKPSPLRGFTFQSTAHFIRMVFRSGESGAFAEGVDALGGMYYGEPSLHELPWYMSTSHDFHQSGSDLYQMCQTNSTVFSPFVFADPEVGELPVEITDISVGGASDGDSYKTDETFSRTFSVGRITGLVFATTDTFENVQSRLLIDLTEAKDAVGTPENAAALFDPFYEWNAMSY